jgi:carboxymethylenebutenolidase
MEAYYAHPEEPGDFPSVIIYMDAPGYRDELKGFARRIAANGYFCLLPDMYYRIGALRFRLSHRDAAMSHVINAARDSLSHEMVMSDTAAMLAWLEGHSRARTEKWGCVGYCLGGAFPLSAAGTFPDSMAAGAALYGTRMVTDKPDSPHLMADRMRAELYIGYADRDKGTPPDLIATLAKTLDKHGVAYDAEVHANALHGFCFPERADYNESAAERAWGKVFALFARQLQS